MLRNSEASGAMSTPHSATSNCHYDQPGHFELKELTLEYEIKSKFTSHQGMKGPGIAWADEGAPSAVTLYVREVKRAGGLQPRSQLRLQLLFTRA